MAAVSSSSSPPRHLRASAQAAASAASAASSSSEDIPDVTDTRTLQDTVDENATAVDANATAIDANATAIDANATDANATKTADDRTTDDEDEDSVTVQIPADCLNLLAASANEYGDLKKENYFVFTDGMSNGYYSFNNMTTYSDLPMMNKFGFVTLTCQCHSLGGRGNCCQGNRAKLDVSGIDDPSTLSTQMQEYFLDICSVTSKSIGDNKLPPTGELPTTARPTTSIAPTSSAPPSMRPSVSIWPSMVPTEEPTKKLRKSPTPEPTNAPTASPVVLIPGIITGPGTPNGSTRTDGGLNPGAWTGIAIAGACVLTLMMYLVFGRNKDDETDDDNLDEMSRVDNGKDLLQITANGEMDPDRPPRIESPDATNSMTASDVSSIQTMGTSGNNNRSAYYADNSLLPGLPDEESITGSSDNNDVSLFTDGEEFTEEGVEIASPRAGASNSSFLNSSSILNTSNNSSGSDNLDHAIESGNWEAVAASAAAIVKRNESTSSIGASV
eukprot:CAMPEP_0201902776 /NCGR_PEP_ID=MMETSP0902-20130614/55129_1 /ASSEMBLY_ACC=CAM_ASM_000551 /TAXON_ID=420261 /ORGANISM="Thalassiosira antarctica, Strain CCMP982" /LENGTH=500 /DNA_ID=CAMNT_0048436793 /DNA_START=203 /DNA_END=1705 /DNA_ORIENTATION=+